MGPLPASLADLVNVARFDVQGNNITGGTLPAMNFVQMAFCYLFDNPASSAREHNNTFLCPWPQGAVAKCRKEDSSGNWVPITEVRHFLGPNFTILSWTCVGIRRRRVLPLSNDAGPNYVPDHLRPNLVLQSALENWPMLG